MTLQVLKEKGESNRAIAKRLGVAESVVRYHLKRQATGSQDGRKKQVLLIDKLGLAEVVRHWWQRQLDSLPSGRSPNINGLWLFLSEEHNFSGSYKAVQKYVRRVFLKPKLRAFRRVETPPGAQTQSDWMEAKVNIGFGREKLYGFLMTLSHSRMKSLIWSRSMNQLAWQHVHTEAFQRLGGVAAVNRIDNLKTGVAHGAGSTGKINESYQAYARTMGFHVDPHQVRQPQQKGKVERGVRSVRKLIDLNRNYDSLAELQAHTDEQLRKDSLRRKCPVSGKSVHATWLNEIKLLRELPLTLPEPFDLIRTCNVHKDCTIRFEGRTYSVPFKYAYSSVEVRGCNGFIQIVDRNDGQIVKQYPRQTEQLLFVDADCYSGLQSDEVVVPERLGRVARKLEEIAGLPVQLRSIDIYAQLSEVCQ